MGNQSEEREKAGAQPGSGPERSADDVPDGSGTDLDEHHEPESDRFDAG
ncbi:hypothetical protein [Arthrobacter woluwensis]|nr:hypothetical protein [Arthrobacter woluwensis]